MKGLIIKDIMCLKKQLTVFIYVIIGVFIVSVMYVLSVRYGNLALAGKEMLEANDMTDIDVKNLGTMVLVLFMLLPIATVGDMANVFEADGKAGFYKVSGAFPVSLKKRLLSRYISVYALFGIGVITDILIAFVLSIFTDLISFTDFLGIIISASSVMSIYSSLVIFFSIIFGYGKEQYSQIFSILTIIAVVIAINFEKVKTMFTEIEDSSETIMVWEMLDFIKEKAWVLFLVAVAVSILSYAASLLIAERKRGVI